MKMNYYAVVVVFAIVVRLNTLSFFNNCTLITIETTAYAQLQPQSQPPPQQRSQAPSLPQQKPQTGIQYIFNEKSKAANAAENCASLASVDSRKGVPDYNLCDIVVYCQVSAMIRNDGLVLEEIKFVYIQ
jgi:hypothetical protein